ncbi:MAG: hypothetical protein K2X27_06740 [Candidatus Obscuribacterales bacterium]|nr:hypothetical protein [Candidatus Obscuribacterales bacterium]
MVADWLEKIWSESIRNSPNPSNVRLLRVSEEKKQLSLFLPDDWQGKSDWQKQWNECGVGLDVCEGKPLPTPSGNIDPEKPFPRAFLFESILGDKEFSSDGEIAFTMADLVEFESAFNLKEDGDPVERLFCDYSLEARFPGYERMWRSCILPITRRIDFFPVRSANTNIRTCVDDDLIQLAQIHYSVMTGLVYSVQHIHFSYRCFTECRLFDGFAHLGNVAEQSQLFLLKWIAEIEELASWADIKYRTSSLRDWKTRSDVIKEFLTPIVGEDTLHGFYAAVGAIAIPRNAIVHGPEIAKLVMKDQEIWIAKNHQLNSRAVEEQLQWWSSLFRMKDTRVRGSLEEAEQKLQECLSNLLDVLNTIWLSLEPRFYPRLEASHQIQGKYRIRLK